MKRSYIQPVTQQTQSMPMSMLMASGGNGFNIQGGNIYYPIDYNDGGADAGTGV